VPWGQPAINCAPSGGRTRTGRIIIPGAILLAFTFNNSLSATLQKPAAKYIWGLIGAAALAYAFLN